MAPCIKELIFHLLAELFRKIHHLEQLRGPSGLSSSIGLLLNPCLAVLMALQTELRKLYDHETQSWGAVSGGATEQSRFSTYFHALMEVCLAVAEVTLPPNASSAALAAGQPSSGAPNLSDSSSSSSSSAGQTPQSPSLISKRKKVKLKRERLATPASAAAKRPGARIPDGDGALLNVSGGKPEDMLWFHRGLTLLAIIRHLAKKDPQGSGVTGDAIADACQTLLGPTAHARLLVLSGIPTHLEEAVVRNAIRKACNAHGGLFKDEIFIPLQEKEPERSNPDAPQETVQHNGGESPGSNVISSQESLESSVCSTGSLGSLGDAGDTSAVSEGHGGERSSIKGYAVMEVISQTYSLLNSLYSN